jgi:23S rRNA pseudouridine2605 synthase
VPPRYAYWTILIDDKPTAFRARERDELQPTLVQLQRKNSNVVMRWFARGKLWASREAERDDFQMQKHAASAPRERRDADTPAAPERRGSDWRPGGAHKDPRDRFKKKNRPERAWSEKDPATQRDRDKPGYAASRPREPHGDRPWNKNPPSAGSSRDTASPPRGDRPWTSKPAGTNKPAGPPRRDRPWSDKPSGDAPRGDRPWQNKPRGDRPWSNKPPSDGKKPWSGNARDRFEAARPPSQESGEPRRSARDNRTNRPGGADVARPRERKPWSGTPAPPNDRPWQTKPTGPRAQRKPWVGKGASVDASRGNRPWSAKPPGGPPRGDRPWSAKPPAGAGGKRPWSAKPSTGAGGKRPWSAKPSTGAGEKRPWSAKPPAGGGEKRPWSPKPRDPERKAFAPRGPQSGGRPAPRKKRDDDPDRDS